jgi:hypothetical protein
LSFQLRRVAPAVEKTARISSVSTTMSRAPSSAMSGAAITAGGLPGLPISTGAGPGGVTAPVPPPDPAAAGAAGGGAIGGISAW